MRSFRTTIPVSITGWTRAYLFSRGRCLTDALMIDNADARAEIGDIPADRGGWTDLADIKDRLVPIWHAQPARTVQVLPLCLELTVAVEHLDAMVFSVGNISVRFYRGSSRSCGMMGAPQSIFPARNDSMCRVIV